MLDMHWHVYVVYVRGGHCALTLSLALAFGHVHTLDVVYARGGHCALTLSLALAFGHVHTLDVVYDRGGHCALTFQGLWH